MIFLTGNAKTKPVKLIYLCKLQYPAVKTIISIFLFTCLIFSTRAQITITSADMPVPGDTVRKSTTAVLGGLNYQLSGANQTWDFSQLLFAAQQVDTFVQVAETPSIYQLFFNNQFIYPDYKATVARQLAEFTSVPSLQVSDAYQFMKNDNGEFREVGYGVSVAGVPLPVQFQQIDTIYRFPLEYGDVDSSQSRFQAGVPDLGYLMIRKSRRNYVDGWGTVITPYDQFQALRVKTEIVEYDSLYIDSLGMGMPLTRYITEYKWLAQGHSAPVMQVTEEGFLVTASYIDTARSSSLSIPEGPAPQFEFAIFPNPCNDYLSVSYELLQDSEVRISLYSVYGNEIKRFSSGKQEKGLYNRVLYLKDSGIRPGLYLLRLTVENIPYIRRILLN
jgi:hypothetical protein